MSMITLTNISEATNLTLKGVLRDGTDIIIEPSQFKVFDKNSISNDGAGILTKFQNYLKIEDGDRAELTAKELLVKGKSDKLIDKAPVIKDITKI